MTEKKYTRRVHHTEIGPALLTLADFRFYRPNKGETLKAQGGVQARPRTLIFSPS